MPKKNKTRRRHSKALQVLADGMCAKRNSMGISQYELADITGLTRNCIQQIECYEHFPGLKTIFGMALELHFQEEEFKQLLWDSLLAYREDIAEPQNREKELAGAL